MNVAIIGSRTCDDSKLVFSILDGYKDTITKVISGGAKGADTIAEGWAYANGKDVQVFYPDWEKFGKSAGFKRNVDIIDACQLCIAFWDGKSKGTLSSINLCKKSGKTVKIVEIK